MHFESTLACKPIGNHRVNCLTRAPHNSKARRTKRLEVAQQSRFLLAVLFCLLFHCVHVFMFPQNCRDHAALMQGVDLFRVYP